MRDRRCHWYTPPCSCRRRLQGQHVHARSRSKSGAATKLLAQRLLQLPASYVVPASKHGPTNAEKTGPTGSFPNHSCATYVPALLRSSHLVVEPQLWLLAAAACCQQALSCTSRRPKPCCIQHAGTLLRLVEGQVGQQPPTAKIPQLQDRQRGRRTLMLAGPLCAMYSLQDLATCRTKQMQAHCRNTFDANAALQNAALRSHMHVPHTRQANCIVAHLPPASPAVGACLSSCQ